MIIEWIKWNKIKGKDCISPDKCRRIGNATSLQDAKDMLMENEACRNKKPGSILRFSPEYSNVWGAFCILRNETKDIIEINPNWEYYVVKWEGKNSIKT